MLALWLGRAAAGRIAQDPDGSLELARQVLTERRQRNPDARPYLSRWEQVIGQGPESTMRLLTATDPAALSMQNMSPFTKGIPLSERARIAEMVSREAESNFQPTTAG